MPNFQLTPEVLVMIVGVCLALAFSYIPGLNVKFAALLPEVKRSIMLVLLLLTSAAVFVLGCAGVVQVGFTCDKVGFWQLFYVFILAIISNQSTYAILPLPAAVKEAAKPVLQLPPLATASGEPVGLAAPESKTGGE